MSLGRTDISVLLRFHGEVKPFASFIEIRSMVVRLSMSHKRLLYLDQIKAVIVGLVIALHVPVAFFPTGWSGVRIPIEGIVGEGFIGFFNWYIYAINSFIMPMMFLISGYFVPRSVHKKGVVQYLKNRSIRIGIPFVIGLFIVNNFSLLIGRLSPSSPLEFLSLSDIPFNRIGVLWFLLVLFVFDLIYCAWVKLRGDHYVVDTDIPAPTMHSWVISAVVLGFIEVAMSTQTDLWAFLRSTPLNGLGFQGMHVFTYAFLFFIGCKASFHHWFERIDPHLVIKWFRLSMFLLLSQFGFSMVLLNMTLTFNIDIFKNPASLILFGQFIYPAIAWGVLSYLIMWFQRHEDCFGQWLSVAGSNSYGAYVIHPMVLVLVLMAVGFIGLNPWLTALNAMVLTTLFSFGFAGLLRRFPVVAKIL